MNSHIHWEHPITTIQIMQLEVNLTEQETDALWQAELETAADNAHHILTPSKNDYSVD